MRARTAHGAPRTHDHDALLEGKRRRWKGYGEDVEEEGVRATDDRERGLEGRWIGWDRRRRQMVRVRVRVSGGEMDRIGSPPSTNGAREMRAARA